MSSFFDIKSTKKNYFAFYILHFFVTFMTTTQWQYLEKRPHPWRKQLYIKGRRLKAFTVWSDMIVNELTPLEVAENKELPLAAVYEAIEYGVFCTTPRKGGIRG